MFCLFVHDKDTVLYRKVIQIQNYENEYLMVMVIVGVDGLAIIYVTSTNTLFMLKDDDFRGKSWGKKLS